MDLLDYFEDACMHSNAGDTVNLSEMVAQHHWLHADALAKRLGFEKQSDTAGRYVNCRDHDAPVLRWLRQTDFEPWHQLFRVCFGRDVSVDEWRWKYRDADRPGIAVIVAGRVVAFYGGMPRQIWAMGQIHDGIQVGDVMVHPDYRGSLSRRGPFQMAASTFLEQSLSRGARYWIGFGFPNDRAMRVAEKLGLYRKVDEIVECSWLPDTGRLPWWLSVAETSPRTAIQQADPLWVQMQKGLEGSLLGVRDSRYLRSRYLDRPNGHYRCLTLSHRLTRRTLALAIYKNETDQRLEVLDLLGDPKYFPEMVGGVCRCAALERRPGVYMWLTKSHLIHFARNPADITTIGVGVPTNCWVPGNLNIPVEGRWWLTGGDTDFR